VATTNPPVPVPEEKNVWFYIEKYWKIIGFIGACYFAYNKDWANNTAKMMELEIKLARIDEKLSNHIDNERRNN